MADNDNYDLIIIGGGAGGLVVASVASRLGLRVALVEREARLGGDCLHHGCIPSKTLIRTARLAAHIRRAPDFGLKAELGPVDMAAVNARVGAVIDHIQQHDDPERFRGYGCEVLFGHARFVDPHRVQVGERLLRGRRFVIATGSRARVPTIEGLESGGFLTHRDMFSLPELPRRLAVLGGGPIGVEMAQAYARLGSAVTLLQRGSQLLPREDGELVAALEAHLREEGIAIHTAAELRRVEHADGVKRLELSVAGQPRLVEVDQLLIAAGRTPNCDDLGLEAAGVAHGERGIAVDARMRTSQRHIYACGDVCSPYPFTHVAEQQAGVVISNAVFRFPKKIDYRVVPWVTYCDPELATVGLTEAQAGERNLNAHVLRFPFAESDRGLTEGETRGLVKLVTNKGRLLGASILGPGAGELIHELALAMQLRAPIRHVAAMIHAYPTLSQVHRRAVNSGYGPRLFSPRTRAVVRWINRLLP